ncbi:hypothetical protein [Devosia sp. FKR38]|uniref:hypothetical protein n=1 Tax=Devosia sp. FKR38 TaxID=2562312 RepID=UPI0010C076EA|nr:hypothetical protein [Devosia sp. FKR38]
MTEEQTARPPTLLWRGLIFVLLGVPLGGLLLLLAVPLLLGEGLDLGIAYSDPASLPMLVVLPPFWFIGGPPALVCGLVDARLARRLGWPLRTALTGLIAGGLLLLPVGLLIQAGMVQGPLPLALGLVGLVAGALCSLVAALADRVSGRG